MIAYFTPITGVLGGALIGLSAATLLLFSGEILGASGFVSSFFLEPRKAITDPTVAWKTVFLAVFMLVSNLVLAPYFTTDERWGEDPSIPVPSIVGYFIGGAFVGFGTRLGNGCTTGHGICGMARFSMRSFLAVCTFMASAFVGAAFLSPDNKTFSSYTSFLRTDEGVPKLYNERFGLRVSMIVVLPALYAVYNVLKGVDARTAEDTPTGTEGSNSYSAASDESTLLDKNASLTYGTEKSTSGDDQSPVANKTPSSSENVRKMIVATFSSILFATGLAVAQMVIPSKVLGFFALHTLAKGTYDPTLITVMGGGVIVSFISYQFVQGWAIMPSRFSRTRPILAEKFSVPTIKKIDWQLFGGAFFFGIGWVTGLCPGEAIFLAASGTKPVVFYWWPGFIAGAFLATKFRERS